MRGRRGDGIAEMAALSGPVILCFSALLFKMSFTAQEAPELVQGVTIIPWKLLRSVSLVSQARGVFTYIILVAIWSCFSSQSSKGKKGKKRA
jgi:hypothetical protein